MSSSNKTIQQIQYWLETIIIELNFCPFAKREFVKKSIKYTTCESTDLESSLHFLADECKHLDQDKEVETSLLIFTADYTDFDDFLELIELANQLLDDLGYESIYQLAHFHPDYCFDGVNINDASNYTNRSPYPILHLLRESSLEKAIESHADASGIPDTNIKLARQMGSAKLQSLLNNCLKNHD